MIYKVGDYVLIKPNLSYETIPDRFEECFGWNDDMEEYSGQIAKIIHVEREYPEWRTIYRLNIDDEYFAWGIDVLDSVPKSPDEEMICPYCGNIRVFNSSDINKIIYGNEIVPCWDCRNKSK